MDCTELSVSSTVDRAERRAPAIRHDVGMARRREDEAYAAALRPITGSSSYNTLRAIVGAASHTGRETASALTDLAPQMIQRRMLEPAAAGARDTQAVVARGSQSQAMTLLGRAPARWLTANATRPSAAPLRARDLEIREQVDELLRLPVPEPAMVPLPSEDGSEVDFAPQVSLLDGFRATAPAAADARHQRRRRRAALIEASLRLEDGAFSSNSPDFSLAVPRQLSA